MKDFRIVSDVLELTTWDFVKILVILLVISAIGIGIMTVYNKIKTTMRKIRRVENVITTAMPLVEAIKERGEVMEEPPKSVSSMTRIMEPQIMRDFPEFSWEEFKHKAENMLTSAFLAITANDVTRLMDASEDVKKQVANIIESNRLSGVAESYSNIRIHQTEIANYEKKNGKYIITIQSAVGYMYSKMQDGKLIDGDLKYNTQTKYNVELIYIQNTDGTTGNAIGLTCPQCGAPIPTIGVKRCEYCGGGVENINIRVWSLHKFYEVDYN